MNHKRFILAAWFGAWHLGGWPGAAPLAAEPAEIRLHEDFQQGADRWRPTDPAAWSIADGESGRCYRLQRQSRYQPPHRSPVNYSLLADVVVGDFELEARVRSTVRDYDHRDMCLVFGYQDPAHFYYVHFGKRTDDHANQIFVVDGAPRIKISTRTTDGTPWDDAWHTVRLVRRVERGTIEVYFDDLRQPAMTASDRRFTWGQNGLGSFDDTGDWDDVRLTGRVVPAAERTAQGQP